MAFAIMRTAKLKGGSVAASDLHTDRLRETKNADPKLTPENIYIVGKRGESLREKVDEIIKTAGVTKRKNAVECVEFFLGASPEYFEGANKPTKTVAFIRQAKEFMDLQAAKGMVFVKAAVHLDETTPHVVAYAVPFDEKGKLNARAHLGGRDKLSQLQDEYAGAMEPLALERGTPGSVAEHKTIQQYYGKLEAMKQFERERDQAIENQRRAQEMLERTSKLLQSELEGRRDISLQDAATKLFKNTLATEQGLLIFGREADSPIKAIITPDNKAFLPSGERISDGSSVMLITKVAAVEPERAAAVIATHYDAGTAQRAVKAYGEEVAKNVGERIEKSEPERRRFDEPKLAEEVRAARPDPEREIEAKREKAQEIIMERGGMSR
jgi:hypothetical protein